MPKDKNPKPPPKTPPKSGERPPATRPSPDAVPHNDGVDFSSLGSILSSIKPSKK